VICGQVARMRATAVIKRWRCQPRRPVFHLKSYVTGCATSCRDSSDSHNF
jgi:hypothetical protein